MGFGGPHAAFLATRDELPAPDAGPHHRRVARRARAGRPIAWRCRPASSTSAARRRPATSAPRRCCSRSWPAMYAVYHGPEGLRRIARRVRGWTVGAGARARAARARRRAAALLRHAARRSRTRIAASEVLARAAEARRINLRRFDDGRSASRSTRPRARPTCATSSSLLLAPARRRVDLDELVGEIDDSRLAYAAPLARTSDVPHAPGLPQLPLRARDAALHPPAAGARPLADARR